MKNIFKYTLTGLTIATTLALMPMTANANICINNHTNPVLGANLSAEAITGKTDKIRVGDTKTLPYKKGMTINLYKQSFGSNQWHLVSQLYPENDKAYYEVTGTIGAISWKQVSNVCSI